MQWGELEYAPELVAALERFDQKMRRDFKAHVLRHQRYLRRATPEQMRADWAAYDRRVLERGFITFATPGERDGSGI